MWPLPSTECQVLYSPWGLSAFWKQVERRRAGRWWLDIEIFSGAPRGNGPRAAGEGRGGCWYEPVCGLARLMPFIPWQCFPRGYLFIRATAHLLQGQKRGWHSSSPGVY